jgi:hypothetical protein
MSAKVWLIRPASDMGSLQEVALIYKTIWETAFIAIVCANVIRKYVLSYPGFSLSQTLTSLCCLFRYMLNGMPIWLRAWQRN